MSFKSGDIIENLYHKDNHGVISQNMKTAKVIYMNGYPVTMGIKILEHEEELLVGVCIEVESRSYTDLVNAGFRPIYDVSKGLTFLNLCKECYNKVLHHANEIEKIVKKEITHIHITKHEE